jgi:hypothetical protein
MEVTDEYKEIIKGIRSMKSLCRDLLDKAESHPCLERNTKRILSSLEMLGLDFPEESDLE